MIKRRILLALQPTGFFLLQLSTYSSGGSLFFSPFGRRATLLGLEDPIQIGSGREATLGRNDIIAIVRIIQHHLLCCIETDLAEPYSECRLHILVEEYRQFLLGDTQCAGEGQHIHSTVLISQIGTPFVKTLPDKVDALL